MLRRLLTISLIVLFAGQMSQGKDAPTIKRIDIENIKVSTLKLDQRMATAVGCTARYDDGTQYMYSGFVYGNEAYTTYIDPNKTCPNAYPYTVNEVIYEVHYGVAPVTDTISVHLLAVDASDPTCPFPGAFITLSSVFEISIPDTGLWQVPINLDTAVIVNEPFFAGFYIYNLTDTTVRPVAVGPHLTTDFIADSLARYCYSYNLYDTLAGWEDLAAYGFLGRLIIYVNGTTGGGVDPNPPPLAEFLYPTSGSILFEPFTIWARDVNGSDSIQTVEFEYAPTSTGIFTNITTLTSSELSHRDGIGPADSGPGYAYEWDPTFLTTGTYLLRVIMTDNQSRVSVDTAVNLLVMQAPPTAAITSPSQATDFCATLDLLMSTPSPTLPGMNLFAKEASLHYSLGMEPLNQSALGDNNGNPNDGNYAYNGEFGDYYSGPAAAATALKIWADRGLSALMMDGSTPLTTADVAELLAEKFGTRTNLGTSDEDIYAGIKEYASEKLVQLDLFAKRNPDYFDIRNRVEGDEHVAVIGLGGTPAAWLTVDGFEQWQQPGLEFFVRVADPLNGTIRSLPIRNISGGCEIQLYSNWQKVDMMISCFSDPWPVSRTLIGWDSLGTDLWQFNWTPLADSLSEGSPYFVTVEGSSPGEYGNFTALYRYSCASIVKVGDYNGDDVTDINDFYLLQNYIALGVVPPVGGAFRADANGDNSINLADLVFYMRYLFGGNPPPVY